MLASESPLITQDELAEVVRLEHEIARLMEERETKRRTIENLIRNGGIVQEGLYVAYIETRRGRRSVPWKKVVIRLKGEGYANNVLKNTKRGPDIERLVIA